MNKKITTLVASSILSLTSSALASQQDKFYVAADAGIFQGDFENSHLDQTDTIKQNIAQTFLQHGYTGGIAFGYTHQLCQQYFLGGELSGNLDGSNASFQSGASTTAFSDQIKINTISI